MPKSSYKQFYCFVKKKKIILQYSFELHLKTNLSEARQKLINDPHFAIKFFLNVSHS